MEIREAYWYTVHAVHDFCGAAVGLYALQKQTTKLVKVWVTVNWLN